MKKKVLTIMLLLALADHTVSGQSEKNRKSYTVNVNDNDRHLSVKVDVLADKTNVVPNKNLVYYWYASNQIMETQGGYEGKLLHGHYTSFYLDNHLKEKGKFVRGLKNGRWILWNPDGRIKEIVHWRRGLKHGKQETYNDQGEKIAEADYRHNLYHGYVILYQDGKMISRKKYKAGKEVLPSAKKADERSTLEEKKDAGGKKTNLRDRLKFLFPKKKENGTEKKDASTDNGQTRKSKTREKKKGTDPASQR